jgi:subtilisin family serine protease
MVSLRLLYSVLCMCQVLVVGYAGDGDGRKTFIVRVDGNSKPSAFLTHEHWYRSTVSAAVRAGHKTESGFYMNAQQDDALLLHVYNTVLHGFSARLTEKEAAEVGKTPGVLAMFPDRARQLHTTRSAEFLGLEKPDGGGLWAESDYGSDVVIGVLDTGIWPERRSFSDQDMGPVPKHWKGECESGIRFPKSMCNRKLVGARIFYRGYEAHSGAINETVEFRSARDSDGHGTHTASTAAGRFVYGADMLGYARGIAKGMAPKARIAAYKVCWASGCFDSDILSALDKAVDDGVNVVSLSLGIGYNLPYDQDPIAIGAFEAVQRGVFVSTAGGNDGPELWKVTNVAPWITTVGAGTVDRDFPAHVQLGNGTVIRGVSLYSGKGLNPRGLIYYGEKCNQGDLNLNESGKTLLCQPSDDPGVANGAAVKQAGGVGMIAWSGVCAGSEGLIAGAHLLPAASVGSQDGLLISQYIESAKNPTAAITFHGTELRVQPAPVVASFSSRGPNQLTPEILKPDIIAPGVNILAAWTDAVGPSGMSFDRRRTEFNIISGTSMACPHVSGVAALLKGAHPNWSPAAIKSALMTTAYTYDNMNKHEVAMVDAATGKASTPIDFGAGHMDPQRATDPGLIYDLGVDDYLNFLCSLNYSAEAIKVITQTQTPVSCPAQKGLPGNLNYPSFTAVFDPASTSNLSTVFKRTVTNVGPPLSTYMASLIAPRGVEVTVEPTVLRFTKRGEKLSFMLSVSAKPLDLSVDISSDIIISGLLAWTDGKHIVRSPIVVTAPYSYY